MPESATEHRRWPKRAAWLLILAVLVLLVVLFWEWAATEVCLRLATSSNPTMATLGQRGLTWLGSRAVPSLVSWLTSQRTPHRYLAAHTIGQHWGSLTSEQLRTVAPILLHGSVTIRPYHLPGKPFTYAVWVAPTSQLNSLCDILECVEVLDGSRAVASFEVRRPGWALGPLGPWSTGWRTTLQALPPGIRNSVDGPLAVPGSDEVVRRLQQVGQHAVRITLSMDEARLAQPLRLRQMTQSINTVESLPANYFVPVRDPAVDAVMENLLVPHVQKRAGSITFGTHGWMSVPTAFAARAVVRIREKGQEFDLDERFCVLAGGYPSGWYGSVRLVDLPLDPGHTYHLQVIFKPDRDGAWLDPRITEYWDGEIESDWVEVTVPEREEQ